MEKLDLAILQGKTFIQVIRWEKPPFISKPIQSITRGVPMRVVTQAAHGLTDGWRATVGGAVGMTEANAANWPPKDSDFNKATVIDATTIEFNDVNSSEYAAHTAASGFLVFLTPVSLSGCTARMSIKDKVGGTEKKSLTTTNGGIVIDDTAKTITLKISAADTAGFTWTTGVYDLEVEDGSGVVYGLYFGSVKVAKEVTT